MLLGVVLLPIFVSSKIVAVESSNTALEYRSFIDSNLVQWNGSGKFSGIIGKETSAYQIKVGTRLGEETMSFRSLVKPTTGTITGTCG